MRYLQIIRSIDPHCGGTVDGVRQIKNALRALRIESDVLACGGAIEPEVGVFVFGSGFTGFGFSPRAFFWFLRNLRKYDLFLIHEPWAFPAVMALLVLAPLGKPYHVFTHGALEQQIADLFPIKHLKKRLFWFCLGRFACDFAQSVIFLSSDEKNNSSQAFKIRSRKDVIQYGIAGSSPNDSGSPQADYQARVSASRHLLYLGRLDKKKGCAILLDAFMMSAHQHGYDLVFCGPDQCGFETEALARYGANTQIRRVKFLGFVDEVRKWQLLRRCEAFVLSSYRENFGTAVVEALSCGTPVVISRGVGASSKINRYGGGYVLDLNVESFANAFVNLWNLDQVSLRSLKQASRKCFEECFSIDVLAPELSRVLSHPRGFRG